MINRVETGAPDAQEPTHSARLILLAFLMTFIAARVVSFLIMSRRLPDLYLHLGGTQIHHLNYGIFLLSAVGAYLLLARPSGRQRSVCASVYGIGLGLTFDEFGMWLHLGGGYWQRVSVDAVVVLATVFGLVAYAPSLRQFRPRHWWSTVAAALAVLVFFLMLAKSFQHVGRTIGPQLKQIESASPQ